MKNTKPFNQNIFKTIIILKTYFLRIDELAKNNELLTNCLYLITTVEKFQEEN